MAEDKFTAVVRQRDGIAILDLTGEVNSFAEQELIAAYRQATAGPIQALSLNFNEVSYINSTGIALIVGVLAQARKAGIPVRTFGLSPHYIEIFTITRLSDFMTIYADESHAIADHTPRP